MPPSKINFNRDVRPILSENCFQCHGPDSGHREADLRLDTLEGATDSHGTGAAVVPGKPEKSLLIARIISKDEYEVMPPVDSGRKLSAAQIDLLTRWIASGAKWDEHWAFVAPKRTAPPNIADVSWCRNELDHFVLARLEQEKLTPNDEVDRPALLRRVTLDLTGLLPTPNEVDAFVGDTSTDAYEKVVDRLLKSPRYGEHRARYWMDYARYGDTQGIHVDAYQSRWPYRDYVIKAFNDDMPYDQFIREQIAGDLLPPERVEQLVATGFIRCGIATGEGGTIIEELRVNLARERTEMFGAVFLGLTTGCAACHDHKYDPLTQKDFYSLTAFFNNIAEKASCDDRIDWPPSLYVPTAANRPAYNTALAKKAGVLRQLAKRRAMAGELIGAWIQQQGPLAVATDGLELHLRLDENYQAGDADKTLVHNTAPNANPATFKTTGPSPHWGEDTNLWPGFRFETNTRLDVSPAGDFEKDQAFSVGGWIKPRNVPGGRYWNTKAGALIARMDNANKYRGWNLFYQDGIVLVQLAHAWPDAISIQTVGTTEYRNPFMLPEGSHGGTNSTETLPRGTWSHVMFTYDGSGKAAGIRIYVNGIAQNTKVTLDKLTGSIRTDVPTWLGRRHDASPMQATAYQDIRFYRRALTADEVVRVQGEDIASEIVAKTKLADWTADERKIVDDVYFARYDKPSMELAAQLPAINAELVRMRAKGSLTLICREKPGLAYADVLDRGIYGSRKERVRANVPHFLPPLPEGAPRNRLGLAEWTVSRDNPLTARVTVNRMWQEVFGTGLVETSEDMGTVGSTPSHPRLLDWLAVDFMESGWQVKRLYKMLFMSAAYRQSVEATEQDIERDPQNRLLARGPRFRMDGEMLRDTALQASGLLVETIGGPSVYPYQPPGVWEAGSFGTKTKYKQQHGANLYRRSLYTFWKRMAPMPNMVAFDTTDRSAACVRRQRTNTPLAALVLMNDPQFLEAAKHLAARTLMKGGTTDQQRLDYLSRAVRSREFDAADQKALLAALAKYRAELTTDQQAARALLAVGEKPVAVKIPEVASLTTGKPSTSSSQVRGYPPSLANDGAVGNTDRYWSMDATGGRDAWWQVDLQKPTDVSSVVVVCYYRDSRHYGFSVETSLDGKTWQLAADQRDNKQPSTREGYKCSFDTRKARYIRVNQTHNSANPGRHLVEVMAYAGEPQSPQTPREITATEQAVWMLMASTIMNSDEVINK